SSAAVYRSISNDPPTMLVDEADTIFGPKAEGNEDLRGLLNAGHQRNRPAKRYDAATNRVESIPTFAMAALAGIGAMPDTIEDRAVVVRMRRRAAGEQVSPYRHRRDREPLRSLALRLHDWLRAGLTVLEAAEPPMPVEDRAADTWEPLIAVADYAGGDWPDRSRGAVLALTAEADENDDGSIRVRLLADCRTAFGAQSVIPTAHLLMRLNGDVEAPWREFGHGGLTAAKLGRLLGEYGIRSRNIRFTDGTQAKGYEKAEFADPWNRYCPLPLAVVGNDSEEGTTQASQASLPRPERDGLFERDGFDRPDDSIGADVRDDSTRPGDRKRPGLTWDATTGTDGTASRLRQVGGSG
ncbi:MAG TPA: DUF3631 domain-containing protein, partial [Actinokineospora sp.]|nr:DUF3631 domain-containing protein [Actinokineospora sp.]